MSEVPRVRHLSEGTVITTSEPSHAILVPGCNRREITSSLVIYHRDVLTVTTNAYGDCRLQTLRTIANYSLLSDLDAGWQLVPVEFHCGGYINAVPEREALSYSTGPLITGTIYT
jgi:hypothetical protein